MIDTQNTISRLESQLADLQEKFEFVQNERLLHHLIQDYVDLHDACFGAAAKPENDAKWESLFTPDAATDLYPLGPHQGRDGKMAWAQSGFGRGQGCQILVSNARVALESTASTTASAQAYATVTIVPKDAAQAITVKGCYTWTFQKLNGAWKVSHVKLVPFPNV
ncbi:hypothetical protein BDV93DRAFT_602231 [Ceratobasidium sp. AG-I]|nr:hypothetical protein BDV93DRAFT_602231 [Ceratobasidium sp. AG-I]